MDTAQLKKQLSELQTLIDSGASESTVKDSLEKVFVAPKTKDPLTSYIEKTYNHKK